MDYDEQFKYAMKKLKNFENYLEVEDFRSYLLLLLNLNTGGPQALLSQLGLGGGKKKNIGITYEPKKKVLYVKMMSGLSIQNQLMLYTKTPNGKKPETLIHKTDSPLFKEHLHEIELKELIPKDLVLITPTVLDYTEEVLKENNKTNGFSSGIESLFVDLAEFIVSQNLKYLFLLKGNNDEPDLLFSINLTIDPTQTSPDQLQLFDVFIDEKKKVRGNTFIQMDNEKVKNGNLEMNFLTEIKSTSHSDMYKSHFTIIIPVSSFKKP